MARVILGVGAGIAAYKACELLRLLKEAGHRVRVVPTPDALRFVGEPTWAALSGEPVAADVWTDVADVPHVRLGQSADLVLVAPATADVLARAAAGLAADLLTATLLTARCPVMYAPAMHTEMWEHPATQHNVATLRTRGALVVEPATGRLTGADSGKGRLPRRPSSSRWRNRCFHPERTRPAPQPPRSSRWRAGGWSSRPAGRGRNSIRSASSATGRQAGRATRSRGPRRPAARR